MLGVMQDVPYARLGIPSELRPLLDPSTPRSNRIRVARGLLPVSPEVTLALATVLTGDPDPLVAGAAVDTVAEFPRPLLLRAIRQDTHPKVLELVAEHRRHDAEVAEAILRVLEANDRTACLIARDAGPQVIEALVRNHERLLITPMVFVYLARNPNVTPSQVESVRGFLRINHCLPGEDGPSEEVLEPEPEPELTEDEIEAEVAAALAGLPSPSQRERLAVEEPLAMESLEAYQGLGAGPSLGDFNLDFAEGDGFSLELLEDRDRAATDEEHQSLAALLEGMPPGKKIKLAYLGNAEVRRLLIRDRSKMVGIAVVRSGRMSDSELVAAAGNRNLHGEVIREITCNREAMRNYQVRLKLAGNPKTPIALSITIVSGLSRTDLKAVSNNRNVHPAVFRYAKRLVRDRRM